MRTQTRQETTQRVLRTPVTGTAEVVFSSREASDWQLTEGIIPFADIFHYLRATPEALASMPDLSDTQEDSYELTGWISRCFGNTSGVRERLDRRLPITDLLISAMLSSRTNNLILPSVDGRVSMREVLVAMQIAQDEYLWGSHIMSEAQRRMRARAKTLHRRDVVVREPTIFHVSYGVSHKGGSYHSKYKGKHLIEIVSFMPCNMRTRNPLHNPYRREETNAALYDMRNNEFSIKTAAHELYHVLHAIRIGQRRFRQWDTLDTIYNQSGEHRDSHSLLQQLAAESSEEREEYVPTLYSTLIEGFARWNDIELLMREYDEAVTHRDQERADIIEAIMSRLISRRKNAAYDIYHDGYRIFRRLSTNGEVDGVFHLIDNADYEAALAIPVGSDRYRAIIEGREEVPMRRKAHSFF